MSLSQSSINSNDTLLEKEDTKAEALKPDKDGSNSSTPSPNFKKSETNQEADQVERRPLQVEALTIKVENNQKLEVPIGPIGPTSPVMVSS